MKTFILIKTTFEAIHCWPTCPFTEVLYLQSPHRHIFHVTVKWEVLHNDRDKEFIMMKHEVENHITQRYHRKDIGSLSCEQIAQSLLLTFNAVYVSVFEDDENGAEVSLFEEYAGRCELNGRR